MFLISGEIIFVIALIAFLMGLGIIGNIDVILSTIGEWAFAFLVAILLIVLIFAICKLIGRKKPIQTTILFFCSLCLLAYGIFAYVDYLTDRHNAFYTRNEISVDGITADDEKILCTIPAGSLVSETKKKDELENYRNGIPTTRECVFKDESGIEIRVVLEKDNMKKCGWIDCYDKLHSEDN